MKSVLIRFIFGVVFLFSGNVRADLNTEIKYGRAMQQAQHGNWDQVHNQLNQLVTDNPERPDLLYDSGVAAYRLKNFDSAQAYFKRVTEFDDIAVDLKERAHFNLGNTYVETKQLQQAIDEYEKVLDINPENEHAKDNLRIVKEMLEQEKQKQEQEKKQQEKQKKDDQKKDEQQQKDQQQKDKQKQDQKNQQQKDQDKSDKKDGDSQDQSDQGQKDQQRNKSDKQDQPQKEESDNGQQGEQSPQTDDNTNGDQDKQDGNEKNQAEQPGQKDKEKDEGQRDKRPQRGLDDKQSNQKHDDKEHGEHGTEPSKEMSEKQLDASQGTQDQQKKQGGQQGRSGMGEKEEKEMDPHEQWIAGIMKQQEKSDAQANKAFIRQAINKGGTKQHGQKNW